MAYEISVFLENKITHFEKVTSVLKYSFANTNQHDTWLGSSELTGRSTGESV
jgi:hypothetical protein